MTELSERSIFAQALEIESPESRREFVERVCAGNNELRASVEELLRAHERSSNPLDSPVAEWKPNGELGATTLFRSGPAVLERPGSMIGPYRLMEQIGEGGFGLVFVAEQQHPVRRKVALKVIRPGMDTSDVIARFEAERQVLALMDHPNIARVLDAGVTEAGRPYFVMELVRGIPITDFCSQRRLEAKERLELFIRVCYAVQHAHQKGIIHRDIKPSNVLVTLHDEAPVVKVIDFGVAKALGQRFTDRTIYTRFAAMIGTPLYMSPEQAEMSGLDIDTRSDIYSLGVLLYELLTGSTPFDRERFNSAGFDEVRRIIREEDPPKPSTRLSATRSARTTAQSARGESPAIPSATFPGDLDWIVMKSIEKDRKRRYESAGSLAADVQRFLKDEPIEARPPSSFYRLSKFARRNKGILASASVVIVALVAGTGISVWQAARAVHERNQKEIALNEAIRARKEADEARKEIEEFTDRLKEANILVTSGRAHVNAERWAEAYADYSLAIRRQSKYYNAWIERASLEVQLGLWVRAAEDYSEALELGVPADNPANWGIPQLFLFNGDEKTHREYCTQMLRQCEHDSRPISLALIRSCVVATKPVGDPKEFVKLTQEFLTQPPFFHRFGRGDRDRPAEPDAPPPGDPNEFREPRPPDGPRNRGDRRRPRNGMRPDEGEEPGGRFENRPPIPRGGVYYVLGLAQYRAGQFEESLASFKKGFEDQGWRSQAIIYPALAIVYHRCGRADEAREAFIVSQSAISHWTAEMLRMPVGHMPLPWFDWIEAKLLHREAALLLTGFLPPDDPQLRELEQRSLNAIQLDDKP